MDAPLIAETVVGSGGMIFLRPNIQNDKAMAKFEAWIDGYKDDLSRMIRAKPDFICVPEFGLPIGLVSSDHGEAGRNWRLASSKSDDPNWGRIKDSVLPNEGVFVCLGSQHKIYRSFDNDSSDPNIRGNIAPVFPNASSPKMPISEVILSKFENLREGAGWPDSIQEDVPLPDSSSRARGEQDIGLKIRDNRGVEHKVSSVGQARYLKEAGEISEQVYQHALSYFTYVSQIDRRGQHPVYCMKKSPARKIGEYLDSVGQWEFDVFVTPQGVAAVLICFDAFDPTIFLSVVRLVLDTKGRRSRFAHQAPDVIFVPSYNRSKKLIDMCQLLSRETHTIVVYLCSAESRHPSHRIFAYGYDCEVFADQLRREDLEAARQEKPEGANDNADGQEFFTSEALDDDENSRVISLSRRLIITAQRASRAFLSRGQRAKFLEPRTRLGASPLM